MCASLSALCLGVYRPLGPAKSWVYIFLGFLFLVWQVSCYCATGGGSRGGGVLGPLGYHGPLGCRLRKCRAAHGPRHPAVMIPLRLCMLGFVLFVRCFLGICMVSCVGFMVFGVERCLVWCPSRPAPCLLSCLCPLSLSFLFGLFADDVFSFFLSLSQALGKPKPYLGFGFPLVVSSCWTRTSSTTRTPSSALSPRLRPRTCFCFFFPSRRRRSLVCWLVLWRSVAFLSGFFCQFVVVGLLFWVCLGCVCSLSLFAACMQEYKLQ